MGTYNDCLTSATIHFNAFGDIGTTEKLHWTRGERGKITITTPISEDETVLVGLYGENGQFQGVRLITKDQLTADVGSPATFKLFWVGGSYAPKCEAVTVEN